MTERLRLNLTEWIPSPVWYEELPNCRFIVPSNPEKHDDLDTGSGSGSAPLRGGI